MKYCGLVIDESVMNENPAESYGLLVEAEAQTRESRFLNGRLCYYPTENTRKTHDDMQKASNLVLQKKVDDVFIKALTKGKYAINNNTKRTRSKSC